MRRDPPPITPITFARSLRRNSTDAERRLWYHLRSRRLAGLRFRRQQPLGPYIIDFICFEKTLIVEIDGGQHLQAEADKTRDRWLHDHGFLVLRFWNNETLTQTQAILQQIATNAHSR
jgi:very-short-patch-repair endonuclease